MAKRLDPKSHETEAAGVRANARDAVSLSALREQAAGLRRAQAMASLAHVVTAPDGSFETWSETLPPLVGVRPEDLVASTRRWLDLIHPADRPRFRAAALKARETRTRTHVEYRLWRADGAWVHVRQVMEPIPGRADSQGRLRWFNTLQDITEQVQSQSRINRLNRVYAVTSGINGAIVRMHDRHVLFEEACRIAVEQGGFIMAWIGVVDPAASVVDPVATAGDVRDFFANAPMAVLETKPGGHGLAGRVIRGRRPVVSNDVKNDSQPLMRKELDERGINSLAILPLLTGGQAVGALALYAADAGFFDGEEMRLLERLAGDLSFALDQIEKAKRLAYVSNYDAVTALPNRTLFHERLKVQLEDAARKKERVAVLILDVERFKTINDTLGMQTGDALLAQIAKRMQETSRPTTWFARLGGDQFAVVAPEVESDEALVRRTEQRMGEIFGRPFALSGTELRVSARLGIALFPGDGADSETLLRNAEAAVKRAKAAAERYVFYKEEMTARVAEKLALENKLRQALERQEFVLHYQPKVELASRAIVGLEALLRWRSPELGLVAPARFIPLLEETGLILEVGAWALKRASLDHRGWHEAELDPPPVAVNVSAIQLRQRDFVRRVRQAVQVAVDPSAIELEITESLVMEDIGSSTAKLAEVRALGMDIAIDDFGTGYSSLAYLARLPIQTLKIDRSFVSAMQDDATAKTLVETIVSLAHSLRVKVVAEGVETEAQAGALVRLGCDQMQGYLISKPVPPEEIVRLLQPGKG